MKGSRESPMKHGEMDFAGIKEVRGAHPYHIEKWVVIILQKLSGANSFLLSHARVFFPPQTPPFFPPHTNINETLMCAGAFCFGRQPRRVSGHACGAVAFLLIACSLHERGKNRKPQARLAARAFYAFPLPAAYVWAAPVRFGSPPP